MDKQTLLALADQDWRFGQLAAARDHYAQALALDPRCWRAQFQLAWIDSAFAPLTQDRIDALRRQDLPQKAAAHVELLAGRAVPDRAKYLPGDVRDWSIETMRQRPEANERTWWERQAALVAAANQPGLAHALYEEAAKLEPEMYFDPPAQMTALPGRASAHLAALRDVTE